MFTQFDDDVENGIGGHRRAQVMPDGDFDGDWYDIDHALHRTFYS